MATVLLTWELGSGIGHLMNLLPIGQELVRRGHRVVAALRDLSHADEIFAGSGISFLPAPAAPRHIAPPFEKVRGFAHVLGNIGFASTSLLRTTMSAWKTIFDAVGPDLVVADHSPTALLALRGRQIPRANVGLGFFCPPDGFPLPFEVGKERARISEQMASDECQVLQCVNKLLIDSGQAPLSRLSQIFTEIDEVFLATYMEFDHFGPRSGAKYWGHWPFGGGVAPEWPNSKGQRIYAYLKPFAGLEALLQFLKDTALPTIILAGGIDKALQQQFAAPSMRFEERPLDLRRVAGECDLAILNAGHGTTVGLLLAGKPCVLAPMHTEQAIFARKVQEFGAGIIAPTSKGPHLVAAVNQMLHNPKYLQSARVFAQKYRGFVPGSQIPEIVNHLERLAQRKLNTGES